ncbi:MAG: hypothetical protein QM610_09145 [Chitinophagaceae bacterium]
MKKIIHLTLALSLLAAIACKNNDATTQKIDFTQSYENAALALTSAQDNLTAALATNDTARINAARKDLETATSNYETSKNNLVQHGGTVNQAYEAKAAQSSSVLAKAVAALTAASDTTTATDTTTLVGKVGQSLGKSSQAVQNIAAKKAKAQQDIENVKKQTEKNIQDTKNKSKKLKDGLNKLFK